MTYIYNIYILKISGKGNITVEFEWDENKNNINIAKHGIDFVDAKEIWQGKILELESSQLHHGEKRIIAIGMYKEYYITVIYTLRNNVRRLISARKARRNEQKNYENKAW